MTGNALLTGSHFLSWIPSLSRRSLAPTLPSLRPSYCGIYTGSRSAMRCGEPHSCLHARIAESLSTIHCNMNATMEANAFHIAFQRLSTNPMKKEKEKKSRHYFNQTMHHLIRSH